MGISSMGGWGREIVGPVLRLANGSSSRRKSGGGESRGEDMGSMGDVGAVAACCPVLALLMTPVQRPRAAADDRARSLDILLLGGGEVGEVGEVGLELEEPWRKEGTRTAPTERRFFIFCWTDWARRGAAHDSSR
jgi:hypothetical protein